MSIVLGGNCPGDNYPRWEFSRWWWGICPRWELTKVIVQGVITWKGIVRTAIILGGFSYNPLKLLIIKTNLKTEQMTRDFAKNHNKRIF